VAVHRSHIDERTSILLVHVLDAGLGSQERAIEMNGDQLFPISKGKLLDWKHDLDAGV
jgi:hypothetical protein